MFGKPTVVNNVETLVNILPVLAQGGPAYAESSLIYLTLALEPQEIGTSRSTGPKLFSISGHVEKPGVYEVPFGETLGNMIERAGGIAAAGSCRRRRSAERRACSSVPTISACH